MAWRLCQKGLRVLILERGKAVPREDENWNVNEVFLKKRYSPGDIWLDRNDKPFKPSLWYNVGGATKFFGTVMLRLRERDFEEVEHAEGTSPAWPFRYRDLESYYCEAERLYGVHGDALVDPTEPSHSKPYPYPPVGSEPFIASVTAALRQRGLNPFPLPVAVDLHQGGKCVRCRTCDGFACKVGAKNDAETRAIEPALASGNAELWANAFVTRLIVSPRGGKISAVEVLHEGQTKRISGGVVVLASGAVNSAAVLLRSACSEAPGGVANASGMVGRHYMTHNLTTMMAVSGRRNPTNYQKTLAFNDFYFGEDGFSYPMGNVQTLGKLQEGMLVAGVGYLPTWISRELTKRSLDILIQSEDLPRPDHRVVLLGNAIKLIVGPNNLTGHRRLINRVKSILRDIGFPLILSKTLGIAFTAGQAGTIRMGIDPARAPLDPFCRSFEHQNLFVADASVFPSVAAVNPALTVVANSLRVADHILAKEFTMPEQRVAA
jgi:choline dehydrogenase-like flavoprotein